MDRPALLALAGGVFAGLVLAVLFRVIVRVLRHRFLVDVPAPDIGDVECQATNRVRITWTVGSAPAGATLVGTHVRVYDDPGHAVPDSPQGESATPHGTASPINHTINTAITGGQDLVALWAEYRVFVKDTFVYESCGPVSGSGSGSGGSGGGGSGGFAKSPMARVLSPATADRLEAVPHAYRASPVSLPPGAAGDVSAALGELAEAGLTYAPEASSPVEPVWRARTGSGAGREWTLCLLYHGGRFGALLTAVGAAGGREVRLAWVASDWNLHGPNRLAPESEEVSGIALWVRPA